MAKRKRRSKPTGPQTPAREQAPARSKTKLEPVASLTSKDWIALGAFFASGFVALIYELVWIRKSAVAFGTASFALSTVLAVFFGGLSLGSYLFGRRAASFQRPLRVYAWLEIGISVWALLTPVTFSILDSLYGLFFRMSDHSFVVLTAVRALLVTVAILPATVLMGASLPIFCRHFVTSNQRVSAPVGLLYGINTLGAAAGCAVCGFVMVPMIGVTWSLVLAVIINLSMAVLMFRVSQSVKDPDLSESPTEPAEPKKVDSDPTIRTLYWVFFGTGFVALGYEVLWSRYLSLLIFNNVYNHTLTITVILVGIVLGSLISSRIGDRTKRQALIFGLLQIGSGLTVMVILLLPATIWGAISPTNYRMTLLACTLVLLPPAILSGASFPLAMRMAVDQADTAATRVGFMTAMNTVGGIVGSLLAGFVLLPMVGLQGSLNVLTGCSILVGFAAVYLFEKSLSRNAAGLIIVATALVWIAIPRLMTTKLPHDFLAGRAEGGPTPAGQQASLTQRMKLLEVREGIGVDMAVLQNPSTRNVELQINRLWQGQNRKNHQIMAAHLPTILHKDPKSVLMVGVGCGQTASRFLMHDIQSLECVEIESGLVELIGRHFPSDWMKDERTKLIIEDGRNYVAHTGNKYDLISLEVGQVFRPGVAGFYTLDFYQSARSKLNEDGFLCQFVPIDSLSPADLRTVVKTFTEVFPQSTLWFNRAELLLIGVNADSVNLSLDRLSQLSDRAKKDMNYAYFAGSDYAVHQPEIFLSSFLCGPKQLARLADGGQIYRDDRPWLEYRVADQTSQQVPNAEMIRDLLSEPTEVFAALTPNLVGKAEANRKLNIKSWFAQANIEHGVSLAGQKDISGALTAFKKAAALLPQSVVAQLNLSLAFMLQSDFRKAETMARQALKINPESADAHLMMAQVLKARNKDVEAETHFERYKELAPSQLW